MHQIDADLQQTIGEGRELERPEPGAEISILIAVDRFGNAGIKAVLVNGEPRYVERLF